MTSAPFVSLLSTYFILVSYTPTATLALPLGPARASLFSLSRTLPRRFTATYPRAARPRRPAPRGRPDRTMMKAFRSTLPPIAEHGLDSRMDFPRKRPCHGRQGDSMSELLEAMAVGMRETLG